MAIRNFLQKDNIREEIVTIPWYEEGPGIQRPILMKFICTMKPYSRGTKFMVHGVDYYIERERDEHLYYQGDPMEIPRLKVAGNKKKLREALAVELTRVTGALVDHVSNVVMWYSDPNVRNNHDDDDDDEEIEEDDDDEDD
jgi:hypothetical protein